MGNQSVESHIITSLIPDISRRHSIPIFNKPITQSEALVPIPPVQANLTIANTANTANTDQTCPRICRHNNRSKQYFKSLDVYDDC